jgi:hypothetical protein
MYPFAKVCLEICFSVKKLCKMFGVLDVDVDALFIYSERTSDWPEIGNLAQII